MAALSGPNEFAEFYSRLKVIRDFHKKHPNEVSAAAMAVGDCQTLLLMCYSYVKLVFFWG